MILVIAFAFALNCGESKYHDKSHASNPADSLVVVLKGENDKSVFDITVEKHKVNYERLSGGVFIKGIDSLESNSQYGWLYSVNDTMAEVAADKYMTKDNDIIKWHYRRY